MPIENDSGKTFLDLTLGLADEVGLAYRGTDGKGELQLPRDGRAVARLKRFVNRAYKELIAADDWTFVFEEVVITTVNGQWLYDLPYPISTYPNRQWRYTDDTSTVARLMAVSPTEIDDVRQVSGETSSGTPTRYAIRPVRTASPDDQRVRYQLDLWPTPSGVFTMQTEFRITPYDMTLDTERPISPAYIDETLHLMALAKWLKRDRPDVAGVAEADAMRSLNDARRIDRQQRHPSPRTLRGDMTTKPWDHRSRFATTLTFEGTSID